METVFTNAIIVTPDETFPGRVLVRDGTIVDVDTSLSSVSGAVDCEGDFIIPGLVDIHTDNLEKHYQPRPGVTWDPVGAAIAHDAQMAAAGVTTVFDSLSLYGVKGGFDRGENLAPMIRGIDEAEAFGLLRIDHRLHLRCEVSTPSVLETLAAHLDNPRLGLLSIMDHTPGQRQMRNVTMEEFDTVLANSDRSPEEIARLQAEFRDRAKASFRGANRQDVARAAKRTATPLASHDDETPDHVDMACTEGATISEFPVTLEAARMAKQRSLHVVMGAPNLLRGGSHSGNVSVAEVAQAGALDGLASDYLPLSMIRAAFTLITEPFNWSLGQAIATVTKAPATAAGLTDRGEIGLGLRADLVRVRRADNGWPHIRGVWHQGVRVV